MAEELGLIEAIGDWVIDAMASQQRAWAGDGLDLSVGFNLSPRQLWSAHLADKVIGKLQAADVDPSRIVVEITESTAMADPGPEDPGSRTARGACRSRSTTSAPATRRSRAWHLPVDILKIDRSFIRDVHRDTGLASMVRAMISSRAASA